MDSNIQNIRTDCSTMIQMYNNSNADNKNLICYYVNKEEYECYLYENNKTLKSLFICNLNNSQKIYDFVKK